MAEPSEVDEMFFASGKKFDRKIVESNVIARLYKVRTESLPKALTPDLIREDVQGVVDIPPSEDSVVKTVRFRRMTGPNP